MKQFLLIASILFAGTLKSEEVKSEGIIQNEGVVYHLSAQVEPHQEGIVRLSNIQLVSNSESSKGIAVNLLGYADSVRNFNFICKKLGFKTSQKHSEVKTDILVFEGFYFYAAADDHADGEVEIEDLSRYSIVFKTINMFNPPTPIASINCVVR